MDRGFMAPVKTRLRHRVQYAAGRGILGLLGAVPFNVARRVGRWLGGLGHTPFGVRRTVVERQIAAAFPTPEQSQ
jgi:lauroyl/myristoyl acyltransferase